MEKGSPILQGRLPERNVMTYIPQSRTACQKAIRAKTVVRNEGFFYRQNNSMNKVSDRVRNLTLQGELWVRKSTMTSNKCFAERQETNLQTDSCMTMKHLPMQGDGLESTRLEGTLTNF